MNPPLLPNDTTLLLTRYAGKKLQQAFKNYIIGRDQSQNFDKDKLTDEAFDVAKIQFGDSLVYAERCAASFFFHIKDRDGIVRVYATHLTEEYREEYSDFSILKEFKFGV